jgi:hypothetical protein
MEDKGDNPFTPLTLARRLLNGIPYAGWCRVRERKMKEESCPLVVSRIDSKIFGASLFYRGTLSCRSSRPGLPKKDIADVSV